jgi:hypothetical protein
MWHVLYDCGSGRVESVDGYDVASLTRLLAGLKHERKVVLEITYNVEDCDVECGVASAA